MTHEEFLAINAQAPYLVNVKIFDTPTWLSYSRIYYAVIDDVNPFKSKVNIKVEDNDWVKNEETGKWEYRHRIWEMPEINRNTKIPIVDPVTRIQKTESRPVTEEVFNPAANDGAGAWEWQTIEKPFGRFISERDLWQLIVFDLGLKTMRLAMTEAITRQRALQRGLAVEPLEFPEL